MAFICFLVWIIIKIINWPWILTIVICLCLVKIWLAINFSESGSLIGSKPDCIEYCKELEGCEYITQNKHTQECFFSTGKGPVNVTGDKGYVMFATRTLEKVEK